MSLSFSRSQSKKESAYSQAREGDPLLPSNHHSQNAATTTTTNTDSGLRSRRTASKSPPAFNDFGSSARQEAAAGVIPMRRSDSEGNGEEQQHHDIDATDSYQGFVAIHDHHEDGSTSMPRSIRQQGSLPSITDDETSGRYSVPSQNHHKDADLIRMGQTTTSQYHRPRSPDHDSRSLDSNSQPPLLEIPEEIYAVRKAALKVMKPLTKTWVRSFFSVDSTANESCLLTAHYGRRLHCLSLHLCRL